MPSRKKKSRAQKTGDTSRGETHPSSDMRPVSLERESTSFDYPAGEERLEHDEDIFFDAIDDQTIDQDCTSALSPSVDMAESKTRVSEIGQHPQMRTPYYPKYFSRTTRYSVGVQTVKPGKGGVEIQHPETLRCGVNDPNELETSHRDKFSSKEEYVHTRENLAEDAQIRQVGARKWTRSRVKSRDRRDQMVQVSCSKDTCQETTDLGRRRRFKGDGLEKLGGPDNSVEGGYQDSDDPSCCSCLLTVLYWLALMLLLSFLLSLFLAVFLLFSRNYGLGIGPGLLYSDAEHIRNQVDPYLELHHKGPPPT